MAAGIRVASVSEIPEGTGKTFNVRGHRIAIFHLEDGFHALENLCPECGTDLERSRVSETSVACPYHGWEIDVVTGVCPANPAHERETFPVRVEEGEIRVEVD